MNKLLYACSTNAGKMREFGLMSGRNGYVIEPLPDLDRIPAPEEDGFTFEANASLKVLHYARFTSELVLADDSGIEVDVLGGKPGVHSARFAGVGATDKANNDLLLSSLAGAANRNARFTCIIALARSSEIIGTFRGSVEGTILHTPSGGNGFGYDPLFFYSPLQCSFAEINADAKFEVSHRGQALRKLFEHLSCES